MMTTSAFEILGPIMVGPSSSHTAGALRIGLVARSLGPLPLASVEFTLFNSFAYTYRGHGTDRALVAGILGLAPDDMRVKHSFDLAKEAGLDFSFSRVPSRLDVHPNTATITMHGQDGTTMAVTGESLGGGRVRISSIDGVAVEMTGDYPTLFVSHKDRPGVLASLTGALGAASVNIATMRTFRKSRGGQAYTVFEVDDGVGQDLVSRLREAPLISLASMVTIPGASRVAAGTTLNSDFDSGAQLLELCRERGCSIGELMRMREYELLGATDSNPLELAKNADPDSRMAKVLEAMRDETHAPLEHPEISLGGLLGGQAQMVRDKSTQYGPALMGSALSMACAYAMAVLERSATMGVIVAAPTAGSAGVIPGSILAAAELLGASDEDICRALWNACAVGAVVARNASVSGAEGGCQAEVGTAAAMAASALCELMGATPETCLSAASTAIGNLLGLVCDPVRGLVEYPCQNRNAIGVSCAMSSAQLALSGVVDPLPFDEVVAAMKDVGNSLPTALRETAEGGLAAAPSAAKASRCAGCMGCS